MIFKHDELESLIKGLFSAVGCEDAEANRVAMRLVNANLVGHDSHGVLRVPSYIQWLRDGKTHANRSIKVILESDAIAVLDGQFGLGQTIGEQAMELGIAKAKKLGVAVVALKNSGHLGRIGDWGEMAAERGMISLHFVNTSGAGMLVSPFGGIDRRLSANPIAAALPTENGDPIVLDMSACTIAEGKIRVALNRGEKVPDNCIIDSDGNPTNDPHVFYRDPVGAILPIAGHKGYGLSFVIDLLAGLLSGRACTNPDNADIVANGMLTILMDPKAFVPENDYFEEIERFTTFVKSARTVSPDGEILVPGEIEQRNKKARLKSGIELDDTTWGQVFDLAAELDVAHGFPPPESKSTVTDDVFLPGISQRKETDD